VAVMKAHAQEGEMSARMEDENHGDDQTDALEGVKYYLIR
jgi:hypothetical protein